jgi:hypothetical protein
VEHICMIHAVCDGASTSVDAHRHCMWHMWPETTKLALATCIMADNACGVRQRCGHMHHLSPAPWPSSHVGSERDAALVQPLMQLEQALISLSQACAQCPQHKLHNMHVASNPAELCVSCGLCTCSGGELSMATGRTEALLSCAICTRHASRTS